MCISMGSYTKVGKTCIKSTNLQFLLLKSNVKKVYILKINNWLEYINKTVKKISFQWEVESNEYKNLKLNENITLERDKVKSMVASQIKRLRQYIDRSEPILNQQCSQKHITTKFQSRVVLFVLFVLFVFTQFLLIYLKKKLAYRFCIFNPNYETDNEPNILKNLLFLIFI